ncbi:hypothetical protein ABK040_009648 [Willaertia magna]
MFQKIPEILFSQQDVALHVFSFLDLNTIYNLNLTNHFYYKMLSGQQGDRCVFGSIVFHLFSTFLQEKTMKEDEFLQLVQKQDNFTSFKDILKEFFIKPFTKQKYNSEAFKRYSNAGGVVDILLWKPCFLFDLIYQQFNNLKEDFKIKVFKYLLILSVNHSDYVFRNRNENNDELFTSFNISFDSQPRPISLFYSKDKKTYPPLVKEKTLNAGQLLLHMTNDFNDLIKEKKDENIRPVFWNDYFELDYNLINDQYSNGSVDIFVQASNPPYGIRANVTDEVSEMRSELYSGDKCYSIDWKNCVTETTCWSQYWDAGLDWWGVYGITTYNPTTNTFIVATASTSD